MSENKVIFKNSSVCNHCDYDDKTNTLTLKFHSSPMAHTFLDVPKVIHEGLKKADAEGKSIGAYFHTHIRGKYKEGKMV